MNNLDMYQLGERALEELGQVISRIDERSFEAFTETLRRARRVVLHGVGREGLMMKALAMRLYHLGLDAHVLGDMTTPPVAKGDLLVISAGPGYFSSVEALAGTAQKAGAELACITAQPDGPVPSMADHVLVLPAQTMADDQPADDAQLSVLPMGSLYEGAQYIAFELVVLALRAKLEVMPEDLRGRHTNLE